MEQKKEDFRFEHEARFTAQCRKRKLCSASHWNIPAHGTGERTLEMLLWEFHTFQKPVDMQKTNRIGWKIKRWVTSPLPANSPKEAWKFPSGPLGAVQPGGPEGTLRTEMRMECSVQPLWGRSERGAVSKGDSGLHFWLEGRECPVALTTPQSFDGDLSRSSAAFWAHSNFSSIDKDLHCMPDCERKKKTGDVTETYCWSTNIF